MEAYSGFAAVYDTFMDDIPYGEWCAYITGLLRENGVDAGIVLDLGCGTGTLTELLADAGYDMIGVDGSEEMLELAAEKRAESGKNILYLCQDMREFELYGTVAAVVSVCDCMNYILEREELVTVFRLVNNYLDPGGVFIFDLNTEHKYRDLMGDDTIAEDRDDCSFIWENEYREDEKLNIYDLSVFVREQGDLYRKYQETHYQRFHSLEEIKTAIREAGMELVAVYDAFSKDAPEDDSERLYVIAREHGKTAPEQK